MLKPLPEQHNLIKHEIRSEGKFPKTTFIAVFYYPDCVREFDGTRWTVVAEAKDAETN